MPNFFFSSNCESWGKNRTAARLSAADLQNELRRIVWDNLTHHLRQFSSGTQIVKELWRLLIAA